MKKLLSFFSCTCLVVTGYAQSVGIGTNTPNTSAQLDIASTSKGLLIPRMTTAQRTAIASPANGLMVYDTNLNAFYFYNGSAWAAVNSGGGGSSNWATSGNNIYSSNTGNVGIGTGTGLKEKLSVKGNLFVTFTNPNDLVNGGNRAALNLHGANTGGARVNFLNSDTTVGAYISYYRLSSQLNEFSLNHGSNSRQLSLQENGNVGIGKIGTEKLDVAGNIRSRDNVIVDSNITVKGEIDADGTITGSGLRSISTLTVAQTSALSGPVFGASTASFTGEIKSSTGMAIDDAAGTLSFRAAAVDKGFVQLSGNDLRLGTYSGNTAGRFIVRTGGTNNLVINNDGKTGIGIEDAAAKLHINSGASIEALRLQGNTNTIIRFMTGATEKAFIYSAGTDMNISTVQAGGVLHLNSEVYIDKDANRTGIGTSIPEQRLHVAGNAKVNGGKILNNDDVNMLPLAWARFDSEGVKISGTANISASLLSDGDEDRYFKVSVSGVHLGGAAVSVTVNSIYSGGILQASSLAQNDGSVSVRFSLDWAESIRMPFSIVIYN
jgi:cytoskeletal protein CcmA (bactofilin family)